MTAYAIAHLRNLNINDEVLEYLECIQETMAPFGARFLVHNRKVEVMEGQWPGTVVLVEFPDVERARAWYASPGYQAILPLRTRHIDGDIILVEGVGPDYDARLTARDLRAAAAGSGG